jgi:hypothetical protein
MRQRPPDVFAPAAYEKADVYALKALSQGQASEAQQVRALEWILRNASQFDDLSYRSGVSGDRDTAFAEGRRFVGLQVVKMINLRSDVLEKMK